MNLNGIAIAGYRSFGPDIQRFERFAKINLFIGQNNSGKSNILRLLYKGGPGFPRLTELTSNKLDQHLSLGPNCIVGVPLSFKENQRGNASPVTRHIKEKLNNNQKTDYEEKVAKNIFKNKAKEDGTKDVWFEFSSTNNAIISQNWLNAYEPILHHDLERLWRLGTNIVSRGETARMRATTLQKLSPDLKPLKVSFISAIRKISDKNSEPHGYSGEGIIESLVRLQNPNAENQQNKTRFEQINSFLQTVTGNASARIEIPHEKDTILVHMDGKTLPLGHLGTGIHEVIILASAATVLQETIICMEEPELHLHPVLQKKLVHYLSKSTSNQYFISTHSAALMDTPGAEIYHIRLIDNASIVERVSSDRGKSSVCEDLGYTPSDLLQSNCVIWVEGPSDRTYLNYWIKRKIDSFVEGIHYTIMFYGGRLASHISAKDPDEFDKELFENFISLRRLNRRGVIMIDSDKAFPQTPLSDTKQRLIQEFNQGPGYCWVTKGREIENYIPADQIAAALEEKTPSATPVGNYGKYDNVLKITTRKGNGVQASKTTIASYIAESFEPDWKLLELGKEIDKLVKFITDSNHGVIK